MFACLSACLAGCLVGCMQSVWLSRWLISKGGLCTSGSVGQGGFGGEFFCFLLYF